MRTVEAIQSVASDDSLWGLLIDADAELVVSDRDALALDMLATLVNRET